ncbi:MAG: hypothetical protein WD294_10195 [Phycisphaeraceae bacterium]
MKRLILLVCAALLVACEPESSYSERREARDTFAEAQQLLDQALAGSVVRDVSAEPYGKPIYEYRREQFQAAADVLQPLVNSSSQSDRVAAHKLLAESATNHGNAVVQEASRNWNELLNTHARLLSAVSSLRDAHTVQAGHETIDLTDQIAQLRTDETDLLSERDAIEQRLADLDDTIAEIEAEMAETREARNEINVEADKIARQAFTAEGQEQFDLYLEASELSEASGQLTSTIEAAEGRLDVQQSQGKLEQIQLEQIDQQIQQYREAAEELETRTGTIAEIVQDASTRYDEGAEHFTQLLDYLVTAFEEDVEDVIVAADDHFEQAVQHLQSAQQAASDSATRQALQVQLQGARASFARSKAQISRMRQNYRNLLIGVAEAVSDVVPQHAESMGELSQEIDERATASAAEAEEMLTEASTQLTDMLEPAEARGDTAIHRALLQHLVVINSTMANLTNDTAYRTQATDYRAQLQALSAPEENDE